MRIAVMSDIHGNLAALEAVLRDISRRQVDKIYNLGDLVGKGPQSKPVVDLCRQVCDVTVMGNWEDGLHACWLRMRGELGADRVQSLVPGAVSGEMSASVEAPRDDRNKERARWFVDSVGDERMEWLGALPHTAEITMGDRLIRLFHAHPLNFNRYFADSPLEQRLELSQPGPHDTDVRGRSGDDGSMSSPGSDDTDALADVAVYGDIHQTFLQTMYADERHTLPQTGHGRMLLNVGSVGLPLDMPVPAYCLIEQDGATFSTQFVRVPYDIETTVAVATRVGVSDVEGYIKELRTARYFRRR